MAGWEQFGALVTREMGRQLFHSLPCLRSFTFRPSVGGSGLPVIAVRQGERSVLHSPVCLLRPY